MKTEEEMLGCSPVICTLGLEAGHQLSKENVKIHNTIRSPQFLKSEPSSIRESKRVDTS